MTDERIIEYLRGRGRVDPPPDLVASVVAAVDAAPAGRSAFSVFLPAAVAAAAIAVVAILAVTMGPARDVAVPPSASADPSAPVDTETLERLEAAVGAATERLRQANAVHGSHTHEIGGHLASATWFDWRPEGDQVFVMRTDIDVSAPWWADPDGAPITVGQRISEEIQVISGERWYRTEDGAWVVGDREDAPPELSFGTGLVAGEFPPLAGVDRDNIPVVSHATIPEGGERWTLEQTVDEGSVTLEWTIDASGLLASYSAFGVNVLAEPEIPSGVDVHSVLILTPVDDTDAIPEPDPNEPPDASLFGIPETVPLNPDVALPIDHLDTTTRPADVPEGMPAPSGPAMQVMDGMVRGRSFDLIVYGDRMPSTVCLVRTWGGQSSGGCGAEPETGLPGFGPFGGIGNDDPGFGMTVIDGTVASRVERVWVVTENGRRAEAVLAPFVLDNLRASAFVVFLDASVVPASIVAADGTGNILHEVPITRFGPERHESGPSPTAQPTPGDDP